MKTKRLNDRGFGHIALILLLLIVVGVIGLVGYNVATRNDKNADINQSTVPPTDNAIKWSFVNDAWQASSKPPICPDPLLSEAPVNMSDVTSILYPGQTRGIYKAHGGFRLDNNKTNNVDLKLAMDGKVIRAARYIQTGEIQYMLDFENACGVALRYDHLLTLTDDFKAIMSKLPEPKVNDSTTTDISDPTVYKAGKDIATQVGFPAPNQNTTFDFGVYDYRQPNNASRKPAYAQAHKSSNASDYHAICWLDELPASDAAIAKALPGGDGKAGKTSDYCAQ